MKDKQKYYCGGCGITAEVIGKYASAFCDGCCMVMYPIKVEKTRQKAVSASKKVIRRKR